MRVFKLKLAPLILLLWSLISPALADEVQVSAFEGSTLLGEYDSRFVALPVYSEPLHDKAPSKLDLEGALNSRVFEKPDSVSPLEVVRGYAQALQDDGFEILLSCEKQKDNCYRPKIMVSKTYSELFEARDYGKIRHDTGTWLLSYTNHYLAAKKQSEDGIRYVLVFVSDKKNLYMVDTLKVDAMATGSVQISTKILNDAVATEGKVVLSGIFFETGRDVINDDSKPALETIAAYLSANPKQTFYVVGHTDDVGEVENNVALSNKRAQAVVNALKAIGVDAAKLSAHGVGPFSPASTNASDTGRAKNRRVELVLRASGD